MRQKAIYTFEESSSPMKNGESHKRNLLALLTDFKEMERLSKIVIKEDIKLLKELAKH